MVYLVTDVSIIVNHELERMRERAVVGYYKALFQHLPECFEEKHKIPESEEPIFESISSG
jgi:hypothetical protein